MVQKWFRAIKENDAAAVGHLVSRGADVNAVDQVRQRNDDDDDDDDNDGDDDDDDDDDDDYVG